MRRGVIGAVLACVMTLGASTAAAQGHAATGDDPEQGVHWRWQRVRTWQYVSTPALLLSTAGLYFFTEPPRHLDRPVLFDSAVQDALVLDPGSGARGSVQTLTDISYFGAMAYAAADVALAGLIHDDSWDLSWQMFVIDVQSFALVGAATYTAQAFVGRPRPSTIRCEEEHQDDPSVCSESYRSFLSGHFAIAVAGAGLTCMHHLHMPLYGGGAPDIAACASMIGLAAINGYGRIAIEKHYPTDVAMGLGLGLVAGVAVPYWLHYSQEVDTTIGGDEEDDVRAVVVPTFHARGAGLEMQGQF